MLTFEELKALRVRSGLKKIEMAARVGMSMRAYQELEGGDGTLRPVHVLAIEAVSLRLAVEFGDLNLALPEMRRAALDYGVLVRGE